MASDELVTYASPFFVLLTMILMTSAAESTSPVSWQSCVRDIGLYFAPRSESEYSWSPNRCGFRNMDVDDVQRSVFFRSPNRSVTFAGDSTALRAYIYAVNSYLPPLNIPVIRKVASVPRVMNNPLTKLVDGTARHVDMLFFNMRYISTSAQEIYEAILEAPPDGGAFVITIGNWDLNWKLQRNSPMPHLGGPVHDLAVAQRYWKRNVREMMQHIADHLATRRKQGLKPPMIIFREQFLPNCAASRFTSKKNKYRRCAPLIRPVVVPYYRRLLSPLAWSLNIPVIPMDHIFKDDYKYCKLSDGIHLDQACMMIEQQHIWNVYDLLVRSKVVQGGEGTDGKAAQVLDPGMFHAEAAFDKWMRDHNLASPAFTVPAAVQSGAQEDEPAAAGGAAQSFAGGADPISDMPSHRRNTSAAAEGDRDDKSPLAGLMTADDEGRSGGYAMSFHFDAHRSWAIAGLVLIAVTCSFSFAIFREDS